MKLSKAIILGLSVSALLLFSGCLASTSSQGMDAFNKGDYKKASELLQISCDEGDSCGCGFLAKMYSQGDGIPQDNFKAAQLLQKSCNDGNYPRCNAMGCNDLGTMYRDGRGILQDKLKAIQLFQKACNGGNNVGCNNLRLINQTR